MRKNRKTTEEKRKIGKGDQRLCLQWKRKSVFHSFFKEDIFGRREFICFVLHGCSILIDRKQWHKFVLMIYIIVWVGVCVIPACCFFLWMSQRKDFCLHILTEYRLSLFFSSTYFLFAASSLSFGLAKIDDFSIVHIFISFLNCVTKIAWDYREIHFVIVFFQINGFLQEAAQFQEEQSEALPQRMHTLDYLFR